jgi:hypothetical protein
VIDPCTDGAARYNGEGPRPGGGKREAQSGFPTARNLFYGIENLFCKAENMFRKAENLFYGIENMFCTA